MQCNTKCYYNTYVDVTKDNNNTLIFCSETDNMAVDNGLSNVNDGIGIIKN